MTFEARRLPKRAACRSAPPAEARRLRLAKLNAIVEAQRGFIYRVPGPDTRERAETHLLRLIEMRDEVAIIHDEAAEARAPHIA